MPCLQEWCCFGNYSEEISLKKLLIIALCFVLFGCDRVPPGHRGVLVTLYGGDKGISDESVGVGRYWTWWYKELYLFPTFLQNYSWDRDQSITMQTKEGLRVTADVGITYKIRPENVVQVFQKYRAGIDEITNTFLHNMVRDAMNEVASTMEIADLAGEKKESFIVKVNDKVKDYAKETGIDVDRIYIIGTFNLPVSVVQSINSKIEATQHAMRVHNEILSSKAEAEKRIVEAQAKAQQIKIEAQSQAEANRILAESLTPEFVQYQTILKWDGKLPYFNSSNGFTPLVNLGAK